ncbi:MATE family efflux transporter [Desulfurococcus amylolyticus]|uniref:Multidrug-efflux transporter n=1 Tax=Desulfurococcus amylolyticus DSM 16532 TaxID=768672 RepID=I3XSC5_DESAM|nr:MATE family efflux transporter [Desulfurococcus amylolyticus]AFL66849.1 MATE efflux family protein [Desulfurococcus amylolyticus DSM 16532]
MKNYFSTLLNDPEIKSSLRISLPLVFVELVNSLYSLADTFFVKDLGSEALAAVGIAGYLLMLLQVFFTLFQTPLLILVSQSIGAGYRDKTRLITGEILVEGSICVIFLSIIFYIVAPLFITIQSGVAGLAFQYTLDYLRIRVAWFIIFFVSASFDTVFIASGRSDISLISNTIGLVSNIILDPVMIYGLAGLPRLGVAGAAWASVIASFLVIPVQLYYLGKLQLLPMRPAIFILPRKIIDLGLPAFIERGVISLGNNIYAGIISRLGNTVMAAHNIGLRIESIIYMPGFAFAMTASTIVGRHVGEGDFKRAKRIGEKVIYMGASLMGLLGAVVALSSYYITTPFAPTSEIRELASLYLILAGFSEFGLGLAMVSSGAIRGAGNTRVPFITNTVSLLLFRVIPSLILVKSLGVLGPWIAMFIEVYARGIMAYTIFKRYFNRLARRLIS